MRNVLYLFCNGIVEDGDIFKVGYDSGMKRFMFFISGVEIGLEVVVWLYIKDKCEWKYIYDECIWYGKVLVDSCDCGGENGKYGGYVRNDCLEMRVDLNKNW